MKLLRSNCLVAFFAMVCLPHAEIVAQSGCIEIKSILVDACGTPEGENEMVRFDVGASPLNVSGIAVDWPSGNWQGFCQNTSTAGIIASINGLIQGCGSVTEPVGGVLPANSKVLLLTSLNINTILNSFANLNEDLIVLFQCNGNTSGHFANYNTAPGLRTLIIEFTGSGGCIDSVTYDRTLLVNQFGVIGGFSSENDGAFVDFNAAGSPTYLNYGCQVLSTGLALSAGPDVGICPGTAPFTTLTGAAFNLIGNPQWAGGAGTFNPNNTLVTVYTPGAGDTGIVVLTISGSGACNTTITDTVLLNIVNSLPAVTISSSIDGMFSSNVTDPGYFYNWYPDGSSTYIAGAYSSEFTPSVNGCYYMTLSTIGGCSVQSNTLCITNVGLADKTNEPFIALMGNPGAAPRIIVETAYPAGKMKMDIIDIYGRQVRAMEFQDAGKHFEINPDWSDIASGIYIIRLSTSNWSLENKAVLAH